MITIKVTLRHVRGGRAEGRLLYNLNKEGRNLTIESGIRVFAEEWDERQGRIECRREDRRRYVEIVGEQYAYDLGRLKKLLEEVEECSEESSLEEVARRFKEERWSGYFFRYMLERIEAMESDGRLRTAETYRSTYDSFYQYREHQDFPMRMMSGEMLEGYQRYLRGRGCAMNTVSFYMRILRAIYNRAVEDGYVEQEYPFKYVYTGIAVTAKRAIGVEVLKGLKGMDLSGRRCEWDEFVRDMFFFSFYTRGMSFVDMAYLRREDLRDGVLKYQRRKTGQMMQMQWEPCMEEIVGRYREVGSSYMLPILRDGESEEGNRRRYKRVLAMVNRRLRVMSEEMGLERPLTMYVARHTWASIANSSNVPIGVISEGMGHRSLLTTQIYLSQIDHTVLDRANRLLISMV